jgi:hypothetical protein
VLVEQGLDAILFLVRSAVDYKGNVVTASQ